MSTIDNSTALVKIGGEGVENTYPVYMNTVRRENPDWSFNDTPDEDLINELGYHVVYPVDKPEGHVVIEGQPILDGGIWQQTWVVRDFSEMEVSRQLETLKATAIDEIGQRLATALETGFAFTFGEEVGHVQLRDIDRANIVGCGLKADRMEKNGVVDPVMPFRTYENKTFMCTPAQMKILSDQAYDAYLVFLGIAWQLKDAVTKAVNSSEVPAIPPALELPENWESLLSPAPNPEM
jgi:hypothetical protein